MSCNARPIGTISRCAWPFVLTLAAAPSPAFSQPSVCYPFRGGETATELARRITGDAQSTYRPWFQIMDASARLVPKSQYHRIAPGWRACIVKQTTERSFGPVIQPETVEARDVSALSPQPTAPDNVDLVAAVDRTLAWPANAPALRHISGVDLTLVWLGAAVTLPLLG